MIINRIVVKLLAASSLLLMISGIGAAQGTETQEPPNTSASTAPPTIVAATPVASVPFQFAHDKIVVEAMVDGAGPFAIALDSGSETMIISRDAARSAKLPMSYGNVEVSGTTGDYVPVGQAHVARLSIGGAIVAEPFCTVSDSHISVDGYIGAPLFNAYTVQIDFGNRIVNLYKRGTYVPDPADVLLPCTLGRHRVPVVNAQIGGIPARFEVDTGSAFPAELVSGFVKANDLPDKFPRVGSVTTNSVAGPSISDVYDMKSLSFTGGNPLDSDAAVDTIFLTRSVDSDDFDGRIGAPILAKAIVTFDYDKSRIYVRPIPPPAGISL